MGIVGERVYFSGKRATSFGGGRRLFIFVVAKSAA